MGIIAWIIFGALAGWVASIIAGNNAEQGLLGNIIVGILGAILGGLVFSFFGGSGSGITGFNLWSFAVAVLGAVVLLAILKAVRPAR